MPTARKHLPAPPLAVGTEADWYARTALAPESIAAATVLDLADPGTYQNLDLPTLLDQLRDHGGHERGYDPCQEDAGGPPTYVTGSLGAFAGG